MFFRTRPHSENLSVDLSGASGDAWGHCGDRLAGVIAWACLSALLSFVGCPACVAVLLELLKIQKSGTNFTPNNVFMLNLTIMDTFFLFFVPFGLLNFFSWHLDSVQQLSDFLYALNLAGRPLLTTCICLDCYFAVVHPVSYSKRKRLTPRVVMATAVWAITLAQGITFATVDELNHSAWAMLVYAIALPVIVICDVSVLWALKRPRCAQKDLHPKKKKALQIITNSMIMTIISYVPPVLAYVVGNQVIGDEEDFDCFLAIPILVTPTAGSAIMPWLYLGNLGSFRSFCCLESNLE